MDQKSIATIAPSIAIKGHVGSDSDLVIEGRVDGTIDLGEHSLIIAPEGRINADVHARNVTVIGAAAGHLNAGERIDIRHTASVRGNLSAPRVILADGAHFVGTIDMKRRTIAALVARYRAESG